MGIEGRSYTHARRHSFVAGKVGGSSLPILIVSGGETTVTAAQFVTVIAVFLVLLATRTVWAHFGHVLDTAIFLGSPIVAGRLIRHTTIEGRSPFAAGLGLAQLGWMRLAGGVHRGRRWRPGQSGKIVTTKMWVRP